LIQGSGRTRARIYRLPFIEDVLVEVPLAPPFDEETVWVQHGGRALAGLPSNVVEIARFGLTESLRNAADHSGAGAASLRIRRNALAVEISVADRGQGIFRRLDPDDPLRAALDLLKRGRNFLSVARAMDTFTAWSGQHQLRREGTWHLTEIEARVRGTTIAMRIQASSRRTLADSVLGSRVEIPVRLALRDERSPTTRAAARRLLERLHPAAEVVLDFSGIPAVGPAFADEVYRVFRRENPGISLSRIGASPAVERALRAAEGSAAGS